MAGAAGLTSGCLWQRRDRMSRVKDSSAECLKQSLSSFNRMSKLSTSASRSAVEKKPAWSGTQIWDTS